jgi:hypothetical protein
MNNPLLVLVSGATATMQRLADPRFGTSRWAALRGVMDDDEPTDDVDAVINVDHGWRDTLIAVVLIVVVCQAGCMVENYIDYLYHARGLCEQFVVRNPNDHPIYQTTERVWVPCDRSH